MLQHFQYLSENAENFKYMLNTLIQTHLTKKS